uniref:Chitinase domain-containing protein 1 n=1 Tax=Parascaris univalens TaxID=6257 RepID=A0A914ZVH4_PARUN
MVAKHSIWYHILLLIAAMIILCEGTLSKSDRKTKINKRKSPTIGNKSIDLFTDTRTTIEFHKINPDEVTLSEVLAKHEQLDIGEKKFDMPTLGYVTPWNSHGYNLAKWAAKKFTHISPVWFQLKPAISDGQRTCSIGGTHDIDQGWLRDVQSNNSAIVFVPRFIMEGWMGNTVNDFLYDEMWQRRCVQAVVDLIERNEMQGAVMEMWLQLITVTRGQLKQEMMELVMSWADYFHAKDLEFILPLNPPLNEAYEYNGIMSPEEFAEVAKHVDYINVMLYDYHTDRPAGVAPMEWIQRNMEFLLRDSPVSSSKVLLGLNFYGFEFTSTKVEAITSSRYLEHIKADNALLSWDDTASEHFVSAGNILCYYPTLASLSARLHYAKQMNMGVGIWEIGQGLNYFTSVL